MARKFTAKSRAGRIDLNYFKRFSLIRRWRVGVSALAVVVAIAWLALSFVRRDRTVFSMGELASVHASFGERCELCHAQDERFREHVQDKPCLQCHDGPVHSAKQAALPTCGSCHVEHRGQVDLAAMSDDMCTECHADLQVKPGLKPEIATRVTGFAADHPEFAALRATDPTTLKLNHSVHLKADLRAPTGSVQLVCNDCHRPPSVQEEWRFGYEDYKTPEVALVDADPLVAAPTSAHMAPVEYEKACAACHPLEFDERLEDVIPHRRGRGGRPHSAEPSLVRAFVTERLAEYIEANPAELTRVDRPERRLPGFLTRRYDAPAEWTTESWVEARVAEDEARLWGATCKVCHAVTPGEGDLPDVQPPAMPSQWLTRARFDHEPHSMLECESCHAAAPASLSTADVLLPGKQVCQDCHKGGGARAGEGAESRCFECHDYHDWEQKQRVKGGFHLEQLLRGAKSRSPRPAQPAKAPEQASLAGAGS